MGVRGIYSLVLSLGHKAETPQPSWQWLLSFLDLCNSSWHGASLPQHPGQGWGAAWSSPHGRARRRGDAG